MKLKVGKEVDFLQLSGVNIGVGLLPMGKSCLVSGNIFIGDWERQVR